MTLRNRVKVLTISLLCLLSFSSLMFASAVTSNPYVYSKQSNPQSTGTPYNLTLTYSVQNVNNSVHFVANTSLTFLHNVTLLFYSSPAFNYWIYNSSYDQVFALNPSSTSSLNKSFIGNQTIVSSASVPLTTSVIPSTGNYSIHLNVIPVNRVFDSFFSAVVSNSSINLTFKSGQITTSGVYVYPTNTNTSGSSSSPKSNLLSLNWLWIVFIPVVLISFKRRKKSNL